MVAVAFRRRARSRELGAIHARNESVGQAARPTGSDVSHLALATLSAFVLISAIVAGVAEESGFRGYMQGGIEQRHGPVVAILVTGGLFGFVNFSHPEVRRITWPSLPSTVHWPI